MIDRRRFLTCAATGLLAGAVRPRWAAAQTGGLQPLGDRLWLVTSAVTNVLALATSDGLVLVDSGHPDRVGELGATLSQIPNAGRERAVFNTHFHPENTGANETLRSKGAAIIAHENTRIWMATP